MDADSTERTKVFEAEQREPQDGVLDALDERDGHSLAHFTRVMETEPLVASGGRTVHHKLGSEHPVRAPTGDQGRHERVGESGMKLSGHHRRWK